MLAFACSRDSAPIDLHVTGDRLAGSLCAGIGGKAQVHSTARAHLALRSFGRFADARRPFSPGRTADGRLVAFHGYVDNAGELARELELDRTDSHSLYARALDIWGDDADLHLIGEYCTVVFDPQAGRIRLARSPLKAPPLIYYQNERIAAAASVPRAIFAAGVEPVLDETRVADSAVINFTDLEASWFVGLKRVPLGSIVELDVGAAARLRQYYDLAAVPPVRLSSPGAYVERAAELLDEAVRATIAGFRLPGATLSGGLDSSQVVARTLPALPSGQSLPTFTFHPEPGWDGIEATGSVGDERPMVEAFAAMHPQVEPHFVDNAGYGHDHRWNDMFMAMGGAPTGLPNVYAMHGLCEAARQRGCDVLLLAEWGNFTFSDDGRWAYVEYFLTCRWRQLWRALKGIPYDPRSMLRRFVAMSLVPLLPDKWWRRLMRLRYPGQPSLYEAMVPLRKSYRESSGADRRFRAAGNPYGRYQPWNRDDARRLLFRNLDGDGAEIWQAFEQLYGVPLRDPLAYRPFVEFCFGLPTDVFLRDGQQRWLAKELARGLMPEEQRQNRRNGRWDADWHLRIGRRLEEYREELDRIESDPELGAMIDVPRLRAALDNFPEQTSTDPLVYFPVEFTMIRGLLTARFVNYIKGRN